MPPRAHACALYVPLRPGRCSKEYPFLTSIWAPGLVLKLKCVKRVSPCVSVMRTLPPQYSDRPQTAPTHCFWTSTAGCAIASSKVSMGDTRAANPTTVQRDFFTSPSPFISVATAKSGELGRPAPVTLAQPPSRASSVWRRPEKNHSTLSRTATWPTARVRAVSSVIDFLCEAISNCTQRPIRFNPGHFCYWHLWSVAGRRRLRQKLGVLSPCHALAGTRKDDPESPWCPLGSGVLRRRRGVDIVHFAQWRTSPAPPQE